MSFKNWFGIETHPTDEYITWQDKTPLESAKVLREAYDLITLNPDCKKALDLLLKVSYHAGDHGTDLSRCPHYRPRCDSMCKMIFVRETEKERL
jgi:hypothetical protein